MGVLFVSVVILALDDFRLFWMEFKPDTVHPFIQHLLQLFCLSSAHTVAYSIIRISLKGDGRIFPHHPLIECVVEKEVGQ